MMNSMHFFRISSRLAVASMAAVGLLGLGACNTDKLLTAPTPDVVQPQDIAGTAALPNAFNAVLSDFQVGFAGSGTVEGQVNASAWLGDEEFNVETFPTRIEVELRSTQAVNSTMLPIFRNVQRARHTAELVADRFQAADPANPQHAEVLALGAFTYVLFAENYCNGVPTSTVDAAGNFIFGDPQTRLQLLAIARAKFDSAITIATAAGAAGATQLNLARIGKARVLLDLAVTPADFAAAAAVVSAAPAVPTTFAYDIQHDANTTRENNGVFAFMFSTKRFSVAEKKGGNGLNYVSSNDPRIVAKANGTGTDNVTPTFQTLKYQDRSSPTPLALGTEARLIEAEAALQAGNDAGLLAGLNAARAGSRTYASPFVGGILPPPPPPLTAADLGATAASRQDLLFRERAFGMYLTSHRLGDMRRLIRQYTRGSETVFPTGSERRGLGQYGPDVNLPIPFEETNNSKFTACLDRAA